MNWQRLITAATFASWIAISATSAAGSPLTADQLAVLRIRPLLKERCLGCHGGDPEKIKSDYDMRTQLGLFSSGESGENPITKGSPDQSPLFHSVTRDHDDWSAMPPKDADALKANEVEWLRQWISGGAPWPEGEQREAILNDADRLLAADGMRVKTSKALSEEWAARRYKPTDLWAYQPVKKPDAPTGSAAIDALLDARMPEVLTPAPPADAHTFIRRATFDLLGLPPRPGEVAEFESDFGVDPVAARTALIERLLASPHYGERMARHWLDVARYADTSGFSNDYERGSAWRYRDYVIRAFNADKPYSEFIKEQIAGDEIDAEDPEKLVATGFLRMGPWELTGMEVAKIARQRFLDDVTNAVGEAFLSHSLQCARCHDHKFDPVPTHDYYAMQAIFATTQLAERRAEFLPVENQQGFQEKTYLRQRQADYNKTLEQLNTLQVKAARAWFAEKEFDATTFEEALTKNGGKFAKARNALQAAKVPADQVPSKHVGFTPQEYGTNKVARKGNERLKWEFDRYEPFALAVYSGATPKRTSVNAPTRAPDNPMTWGEIEQTCILTGGDPFSPSDPVQPEALSAVETFNTQLRADFPEDPAGRRLALAEWIAHPANPLTTRSLVNRIWLWHFGQPLAGNPNNFGATGKKPTHPELLDWLAGLLVEEDWSIKAMHRTIMLSAAYARSSDHPDPDSVTRLDPLGTAYAVFQPRRLTAEEMRDASLAVTGELNPTLGGIPIRPEINLEAALQPRMVMGAFAAAWVPNPKPEQRHRRSIYVQKTRGLRDPFMEVFNEPAPDFSCERRDASTVTPQVFSLFNSEASANRSLALAQRALHDCQGEDRAAVIARIFHLAYSRDPSPAQTKACLTHWQRMITHHETTKPRRTKPPLKVTREAVEEITGEKFTFEETLHAYRDFVPDLQPADVNASTRALAEVCLVILNSNEFVYVY